MSDVSQYCCITCGHREVNPNDDSWCNVLKEWISFIEEDFTEKVGCASHTDQPDRDNQIRNLAFDTLNAKIVIRLSEAQSGAMGKPLSKYEQQYQRAMCDVRDIILTLRAGDD